MFACLEVHSQVLFLPEINSIHVFYINSLAF